MRVICLICLLLCLPVVHAQAVTGQRAADAAASDRAALQALQDLGPERGGIPFSGRSVEILGIIRGTGADETGLKPGESRAFDAGAMGFAGEVKDLEQAVKDLGAQVTKQEIRINLPGDILFDFDKWDIRSDAEASLQKLAAIIRGTGSKKVIISGHTDSKGSDAYNNKLSLKRANSVKTWLAKSAGVKPKLMQVHGYGESRPVAANDTPEGRQQNRRVEVVIKKK